MIDRRRVFERTGSVLEFGYAIALVFVLTQGPVYKIWRTAESFTPAPISPTWQASFLAIQIPALMLLARRGVSRRFAVGPLVLLVAFLGWMALSVTWSDLGRYSSIEALSFAVTSGAGIYVGSRFSSREQVVISSVALHSGVLFSYLAVKRTWSESLDADGNWTGIYFNRNSLGPVAMLSIVTGLLIAVSLWRARRERYRLHALILLCPLILLDGVVYYRSGSSTSLAATAAGLVTVTLWAGIAKWRQQTDTPVEAIKKVIYPTFVGFALLVAWVGFRYQEFIMRVFGKADFFNGRSALWHFSWTGFLERPIIGWGWRVAWSNPEFLKRDLWWTTSEASWSHNGFLEVLLGGGIVGGLLFVAYVLWAGREMVAAAILSPIESWRIGIAIFVLVACTQEVFIIGNHFLWLMFVAVLTPSFARQQVQRQGSDFPQQ